MSTAASARPSFGRPTKRFGSSALARAAVAVVSAVIAFGTWPPPIQAVMAAPPGAASAQATGAPTLHAASVIPANGVAAVDARNDAATIRAVMPSTIPVLANDLGGNPGGGAPLHIIAVTAASKGRVATDGATVTYDPNACATGSDLFTYTITDGTTVDSAAVVVTIARPTSSPLTDFPVLAFATGSTMTSTVPMRLTWCGVTAPGSAVRSYRVVQSSNSGVTWSRTLFGATTATSSTRSVSVTTSYAWRVRTTDSRGRTGNYATSPVSRVTRFDDTSRALSWSAGWSAARSSSYSGGTERYATRAGSSMSVTLTDARAFAIVGAKAVGRGSFRVYVDGALVATISEKATSAGYRRILYARDLASGPGVAHRIQVLAFGNGRVGIDAILSLQGRRAQAIAFTTTAPTAATVGGATYVAAARATSGYPVSLSIDPTAWSACTISGSTVSFIGSGTCVIDANQSGDGAWSPAAQSRQSFAVAGNAQAITFDALPGRTYGDAPFVVSATASSGLAVDFASTTGTVCSVNGAAVTILAAGDCTIRATQPGNAAWSAATPVDRTFPVAARSLAVTFTVADKAFDATTAATITGCALLGVVGTDAVTCDATVATATFDTAVVGTGKTVTGSGFSLAGAMAGSYAIGSIGTTTASITAAGQTIIFTSTEPVSPVVAGATYTVSATASSGLPVTFTIDATASSICTINVATVTFVGAGTCVIDANQAGDTIYSAAPQVQQAFAVGLNAQTITFDLSGLGTKTYGDAPFAVSATASSGLAVAFASTTGTICSASGTSVTILAAGGCTIRATQAGNATYAPATPVDRTFTVDKATLTVTASSPAAGAYGDLPPAVTAGYAGFVLGQGAGDLGTAPTCSTVYVRGDVPGDYATSCTGGVSGNYAFSYVLGSFHVAPKALSVTGVTASDKAYDGNALAVINTAGATLVGVVGTDDATLDATGATGHFTPNANAGIGKTVQIAGLALVGAAKDSYTVTQPTTTATIDRAAPDCGTVAGYTVTFDGNPHGATGHCLGVDGVTVLAGLDLSGTIHTAAGTYPTDPWTFTDVTGNYHDGLGSVSDTINPADQTITFGTLLGATYGDAPVDIGASTSSGLPITFSSADTAVCTVATGATLTGTTSGTVTILTAGTCTIRADAAAAGNYAAASRVTRAFTVARLAITVTAVTDSRAADGTTASTGVPTVTVGALAAGDTGAWTQSFDSAAAGTGKALTPTGTVSHGIADVTADYDITFVADHTGVITAGATATLVVTAAGTQASGVPFSITIRAEDAFGNTTTSYAGTVHFTTDDASGILPADYPFVGGDAGVHVFSATLVTVQTSTVTATDTVTGSITGTSAPIVVSGP